MTPVGVRAAPAAGENPQKKFLDFSPSPIREACQIGNQAGVPKQNRNGEVGRNRKNIPDEWAAEIWPDAVIIGKRREIPRHPETAAVNSGKNRGADDRE